MLENKHSLYKTMQQPTDYLLLAVFLVPILTSMFILCNK